MNQSIQIKAGQKGFVLALAMVLMAAISIVGVYALQEANTDIEIAVNYRDIKIAEAAAESGMLRSLVEIQNYLNDLGIFSSVDTWNNGYLAQQAIATLAPNINNLIGDKSVGVNGASYTLDATAITSEEMTNGRNSAQQLWNNAPPNEGRSYMCHFPGGNPAHAGTIEVSNSNWSYEHQSGGAVGAHIAQGDTLGSCQPPVPLGTMTSTGLYKGAEVSMSYQLMYFPSTGTVSFVAGSVTQN
ncbi:MAG: hypothetical protein COX57_06965 [Alphaproteobacteria bacterium CG_4_10_14_0_2_um_filter_63_37]|nr:MAG: hypothetical protein AUJ55_06915 [Proteobacteria bacterium CG1_02_64_396]PJA24736.1 MAG: hypothetical protein COX57_06965 [Alphaproteobacteria bacterium CG_4_10_14_0_2_um_filter_63_37]